jgi:hypothetical protein
MRDDLFPAIVAQAEMSHKSLLFQFAHRLKLTVAKINGRINRNAHGRNAIGIQGWHY